MSAGHHEPEETVYRGISTLDEPSVKWGWHSHSRKLGAGVGLFFTVFLLLMLVGNHKGHVEDIWLVVVAVALAVLLLLTLRPKKDLTAKKNRVWELTDPQHYRNNRETAAYLERGSRAGERELAGASHSDLAHSGRFGDQQAGSSAVR